MAEQRSSLRAISSLSLGYSSYRPSCQSGAGSGLLPAEGLGSGRGLVPCSWHFLPAVLRLAALG